MSDTLKIILGIVGFLLTCVLCARCHPVGPGMAITAAAPVAAAAVPASLGFTSADGLVTVTGRVPDMATRDAVVAKARDIHGADRVRDALTIDNKVEKCAWLGSDALTAALAALPASKTSLDCNTLVIEGSVDSEATREKVGRDARAAVGSSVRVDNRLTVAAPAVAQEIAAVLALKNIEFQTSRAVITPAGIATLQEILPALRANPNLKFEIAGHTDDRGDAKMNEALSDARARAVLEYLVAQGLDATRFTTRGYGASRPVADNNTADGRRKNRRIEFVQVGG
jgi:OOP family OmpA-OmpF porin